MLKLAVLVSEFAQHMAVAHELFSKEVRSVVATFKRRSYELKRERPTDTPCSIFTAWEKLLQETEMDAQAHLDAAGLLIKNVHRPLQEVASHKTSQTRQLIAFRELLENLIQQTESNLDQVQEAFQKLVRSLLKGPREEDSERAQATRTELCTSHNDYVLCLRATNRTAEEFQRVLPEVLEELEEIYIDTSNTVNVAIEGHALLMLTKANEQHRRFEEQLKMCRQVNPQLDVTCFVTATKSDSSSDVTGCKRHFCISPGDLSQLGVEVGRNQLLLDQCTIVTLEERRLSLQRRGMELLSAIKQSQDRNNAYVNACQRWSC
ncbi:uncharacterized protein LOC112559399 [Pomacea canaliculata]|uniref:uncharacterized protein LOC112559399 n=1 Tax=Pomacea canaliculata TaxID=400727 RepID=UPI000D72D9B6|nr:uncharacterized protein LOC112559399 [Pomacea canaliculata]